MTLLRSNLAEVNLITDTPLNVFDNALREVFKLIQSDAFVHFQLSRLPPQQVAPTRRKSLSLPRLSVSQTTGARSEHPRTSSNRPCILSAAKADVESTQSQPPDHHEQKRTFLKTSSGNTHFFRAACFVCVSLAAMIE